MGFQGLRRGSPSFLFLVLFLTVALAAGGLSACSSTAPGETGPPAVGGPSAGEIPCDGPQAPPPEGREDGVSVTGGTRGDSAPLLDIDGAVDSLADQIDDSMTGGGKRVVAVLDFASIRDESPSSSFFGRFLAEELLSRLFLSGRFDVIERRLLDKVMEEQKLSASDLADEKSIAELGKLLGADAVLTGTCADMGTEIRANGRLISIESGRLFAVARARIRKDDRVAALMKGVDEGLSRSMERGIPAGGGTAAGTPEAPAARPSAAAIPVVARKGLRNFPGGLRRSGDRSAGPRPRPFNPGGPGRRIGQGPPGAAVKMKVKRIRELYMKGEILEAAKVVRAVLSDPSFDRAATAFDLGWVSFALTEAAWDQRKKDPKAARLVWGETEKMARRAVAMDPGEAMAHLALGQVLLRRGRRGEALADFHQALKLDPKCRKLPPRVRDTISSVGRGPGGEPRSAGD